MPLSEDETPSEQQLRALFDQIDRDGDGFITIFELYAWLKEKGEEGGHVAQIMRDTDWTDDKRIDFPELRHRASGLEGLHPVLGRAPEVSPPPPHGHVRPKRSFGPLGSAVAVTADVPGGHLLVLQEAGGRRCAVARERRN